MRPATRDPGEAEAERLASQLFDRIERACPRLFRGYQAVTEPRGRGWMRDYAGLDARLETHGGRIVLYRYRAGTHVELGTAEDWRAQGPALPAECR